MIRLRLPAVWLIVLLFSYCSGYWKILTAVFIMMSLHECAHVAAACAVGYRTEGIDVFPFGLCARISAVGHGNVYRELCILVAGPCVHLLYPLFIRLLISADMISKSFADYLIQMNCSMLFFNLLLILPLDGGRILSSLLHLLFPYALAQRITLIISFATIAVLPVSGYMANAAGWITLAVLLLQEIVRWQGQLEDRMEFYRYRLHHPYKGPVCIHDHHDLYRMRTNYLHFGNKNVPEKEWLKQLFHVTDIADEK